MPTEVCPAILASVQASQPLSPSRVRNVWRRLYRTNGGTLLCRRAFLCCFFSVDDSTCPLRVPADQTQPSRGFPVAFHRDSKILLTRAVIGKSLRAAAVLP